MGGRYKKGKYVKDIQQMGEDMTPEGRLILAIVWRAEMDLHLRPATKSNDPARPSIAEVREARFFFESGEANRLLELIDLDPDWALKHIRAEGAKRGYGRCSFFDSNR